MLAHVGVILFLVKGLNDLLNYVVIMLFYVVNYVVSCQIFARML